MREHDATKDDDGDEDGDADGDAEDAVHDLHDAEDPDCVRATDEL